MSENKPNHDAVADAAPEQFEAVSISRRQLLKKSVYHAPALVGLGALAPVRVLAASFPGEPDGYRQPGPENQPPSRPKPSSG